MAISSDEERRNVAETLRSMLIGNDIRYAEQFYELLTGDVLPDYQTRSYQQTIEVLANLIDPPVCHLVPHEMPGHIRCDACEDVFKETCILMCGGWNHCPTCGAEVVGE